MSRRRKISVYSVISAISVLVRNFCLPNPFENMTIEIGGIPWNGEVINWAVGIILFPISYIAVSFHYTRAENPALGSILYLFFYLVHTYALVFISSYNFSIVAIIIAVAVYILLHVVLTFLKNTFGTDKPI